jgi:uncharacterized membrane protein
MIGTDEETKYIMDVPQTFYANVINMVFLGVIVFIFSLLMKQVNTLVDDTNKLLGTLIAAFILIKLITWSIHPKFIYKERYHEPQEKQFTDKVIDRCDVPEVDEK